MNLKPALPKIFRKKEKPKEFLVLEVGLERINCAVFKDEGASRRLVGVGRKKFTSREEIFDSVLQALDSLATIVTDFPRTGILGVSGGSLETITTIAKFKRPSPKSKISVKETSEVLKEVVEKLDTKNKKIFFTTVANAKVDGVKVSNPIGLKGEAIELSCFVAIRSSAEVELFDKIADEIELEVERVLPTSFAVAKVLEHKNLDNAVIFRAGAEKSEITILEESHISEILPVDLGTGSLQLLPFAWEAALKEVKKENIPALVWLFADNDSVNLDNLKQSLEEYDWNNVEFPVPPKIDVASPVHNFSVSDIGLYALGQEGKEE